MSMTHLNYRKLLLQFFVLVLVSLSSTALSVKARRDDDDDDSDEDCDDWRKCLEDDWKLSDGAIAGIVIAVVVVFFGIPILICFCCACCCFRYRRSRVQTTVVAVAAPVVPPQYPQQQYHNVGSQPHQVPISYSQPAYNGANVGTPFPITNGSGNVSTFQPPPYSNTATTHWNNDTTTSDMPQIYERPPPYYDTASFPASQPPPNDTQKQTIKF